MRRWAGLLLAVFSWLLSPRFCLSLLFSALCIAALRLAAKRMIPPLLPHLRVHNPPFPDNLINMNANPPSAPAPAHPPAAPRPAVPPTPPPEPIRLGRFMVVAVILIVIGLAVGLVLAGILVVAAWVWRIRHLHVELAHPVPPLIPVGHS